MDQPRFRRIASLADIPAGSTLCLEVEGREILLCHTAQGLYAVDNLCTHAEARLCEGRLKGHRILCPLHGAAFDVRDGAVLSRPASIPLATHAVTVEGDDVLVAVGQQPPGT